MWYMHVRVSMLTWMSVNRVDVRVDEVSVSVAYDRPADALHVHAIVCLRGRSCRRRAYHEAVLFDSVQESARGSRGFWLGLAVRFDPGDICVSR